MQCLNTFQVSEVTTRIYVWIINKSTNIYKILHLHLNVFLQVDKYYTLEKYLPTLFSMILIILECTSKLPTKKMYGSLLKAVNIFVKKNNQDSDYNNVNKKTHMCVIYNIFVCLKIVLLFGTSIHSILVEATKQWNEFNSHYVKKYDCLFQQLLSNRTRYLILLIERKQDENFQIQ